MTKGFEEPNWEPRENLENTEALDIFEAKYGTDDNVGENIGARTGAKQRKINRGQRGRGTVRMSIVNLQE